MLYASKSKYRRSPSKDWDDSMSANKSISKESQSDLTSRATSVTKTSEHLLQPTASLINGMKKLHEARDEPKDDIWFTQKNNERKETIIEALKTKEKYGNVQSKLYDMTDSFESFLHARNDHPESEVKSVKSISPSSRVLMPTNSFLNKLSNESVVSNQATSPSANGSEYSFQSKNISKIFESRLLEPTIAAKTNIWRPKSEIEAEEAKKLEEEAEKFRKQSAKRVAKTSSSVLEPTFSSEHKKVGAQFEEPKAPVNKVKETSLHVLEPTWSSHSNKWRAPEEPTWSGSKIAPLPAEMVVRLLEPTSAYEHGKKNKVLTVEVDPREAGWKSIRGAPVVEIQDEPSPLLQPTRKVKETSGRLLSPNAALENYQKSWIKNDESKIAHVRPASLSDHFLTPTAASARGRISYNPDDDRILNQAPTLTPRKPRDFKKSKMLNTTASPTAKQLDQNGSLVSTQGGLLIVNTEPQDIDSFLLSIEGKNTDDTQSRVDEDLNSLSSSVQYDQSKNIFSEYLSSNEVTAKIAVAIQSMNPSLQNDNTTDGESITTDNERDALELESLAIPSVPQTNTLNTTIFEDNSKSDSRASTEIRVTRPKSSDKSSSYKSNTGHSTPADTLSDLGKPLRKQHSMNDTLPSKSDRSSKKPASSSSESITLEKVQLHHIDESEILKQSTPTSVNSLSPWRVSLKHTQRPSMRPKISSNTSITSELSERSGGSVKDLVRKFSNH